MSEEIRITPERLEEVASLFDNEKENTKELLTNLTAALTKLNGYDEWSGQTCSDFHREWDQVLSKTNRLADAWGEVASKLRLIAAQFRDADMAMISESNAR